MSGCGDGCGDTVDIDISEGASLEARLPLEDFLRMDRMPHIWCPGCGIGSVVTSFAEALKRKGIDQDKDYPHLCRPKTIMVYLKFICCAKRQK